jgi:signal transduction histidine kinase
MVFVFYLQRNRLKRETTRLLEEKNKQLEDANKKLLESERHLKELNSTKDKFFSIIGHDLRNPLNALLGFSELISGNSRDYSPDEIRKYSKIINEAAKNIHMLIENLLEWSRSQSGNIEFNPQETDLAGLADEIVRICEIQAEKKAISITSTVPQKLNVFADRNLLSTILRNLVNNGVKYTPKNGSVTISGEQTEEGVSISVTDTGIGMSKDQLESLFSLLHGPSTEGTADEKGTGLGLILCKEFVDKHEGRIWAESQPEKGSTFTFILPGKK